MLTLEPLFEFSRSHCVAICAVLVPANLLSTLHTLLLLIFPRQAYLGRSVVLSITLASLLLLHVFSWFIVGIVRPPTYILLALSTVCLSLNGWALWYSRVVRTPFKTALKTSKDLVESQAQI
uniref:Uncharacterized protein n=1 Tax=Cyanothece sp. (strain PCC 7425 / ATCC 29141) TaxID=395961 RepID=B8HRP8_CYAP4